MVIKGQKPHPCAPFRDINAKLKANLHLGFITNQIVTLSLVTSLALCKSLRCLLFRGCSALSAAAASLNSGTKSCEPSETCDKPVCPLIFLLASMPRLLVQESCTEDKKRKHCQGHNRPKVWVVSTAFRSYNKFLRQFRSKFSFRISTKLQPENPVQTSASISWAKFSFEIKIKLQLQYLGQASASKFIRKIMS